MEKEDIEKAADDFADREYEYNDIDRNALYKGFYWGAQWRIKIVWHDVDKELPEYNRHVVNEDWFDFTAKDEKDLKRIMSQYKFKRWAYVEDLMPNMEE